ncbi:MAG: hypothetical protein K0S39_997 [Paenibacillus sp.]|jgi:hypothetical protein|nr:hypothetical protein [Paenibacillus sp.]
MKLFHFSEESNIKVFEPRKLDYRTNEPAMVWTIDEFHAPHYFLPRDCPRICIWPKEHTTNADMHYFFGLSKNARIIAIESEWLETIRKTELFRYVFEPEHFKKYDLNAGYYTATQSVKPLLVERMDNLLESICSCGIELRITPSLSLLKDAVLSSTLNFSMIRMRNAKESR